MASSTFNKAVHLTSSRFFGGPERQMLELARTMTGVRWAFVSFSEGGLCRAFLHEVARAGFEGVELKHDTPRLLAATGELVGLLRRLQPAVVCCHGYKADLLGLLAARRLGIPAIAVSRGWTWQCLRVRLYEWLDRRVLRWMDHVVCVSHAQAEKVRRAGVAEEKIVVIHNAIDPERFAHPQSEYRDRLRAMFVQAPERIVGAAGRLSPEKGFEVLIDAASEVVRHEPTTGFVLFGDGPLRKSLARCIRERGLSDHFILAGFRADLEQYLPHFDLIVLPSYTEGLPNVALEACAAGVPVVATAVGGTPEVIEDRVNGLLVPPGDATGLASAISRTLIGDDLARRIRGRESTGLMERFSFHAQAQRYADLLGRLIPSAPACAPTQKARLVE